MALQKKWNPIHRLEQIPKEISEHTMYNGEDWCVDAAYRRHDGTVIRIYFDEPKKVTHKWKFCDGHWHLAKEEAR